MLVKCLQICAHVFIDRPQKCAQTSFRSCAGLRPNYGHSRSKLCPIMCRSRTKLCPNFGCSRARLCPIYFAPCPFPNLAGTLKMFNYIVRLHYESFETVSVFNHKCTCCTSIFSREQHPAQVCVQSTNRLLRSTAIQDFCKSAEDIVRRPYALLCAQLFSDRSKLNLIMR